MPRGNPEGRAEEVQARRRRSGGRIAGGKLAVPEQLMDKNFTYRWANDKDNRLADLTQNDDWDIVTEPAIDGAGEGTPVSRNVGMIDGKPLKAYLLKKPVRLHEADKIEKLAPVKAMEDEIRRGGTAHLKNEDRADLSSVYTPGGRDGMSGTNIIEPIGR